MWHKWYRWYRWYRRLIERNWSAAAAMVVFPMFLLAYVVGLLTH